MELITKRCKKCGKQFSFTIEDGRYHQASRRLCDACKFENDKYAHAVGARTTEVKRKRKSNKKISVAEMDRFAKSIGKSYGQVVALIDAGLLEYIPVPKPSNRVVNISDYNELSGAKTTDANGFMGDVAV